MQKRMVRNAGKWWKMGIFCDLFLRENWINVWPEMQEKSFLYLPMSSIAVISTIPCCGYSAV